MSDVLDCIAVVDFNVKAPAGDIDPDVQGQLRHSECFVSKKMQYVEHQLDDENETADGSF